jgi:hypothetical protein
MTYKPKFTIINGYWYRICTGTATTSHYVKCGPVSTKPEPIRTISGPRVKATSGGPLDTVIKSFMIGCILITGIGVISQLSNTQPAQQVQVK